MEFIVSYKFVKKGGKMSIGVHYLWKTEIELLQLPFMPMPLFSVISLHSCLFFMLQLDLLLISKHVTPLMRSSFILKGWTEVCCQTVPFYRFLRHRNKFGSSFSFAFAPLLNGDCSDVTLSASVFCTWKCSSEWNKHLIGAPVYGAWGLVHRFWSCVVK